MWKAVNVCPCYTKKIEYPSDRKLVNPSAVHSTDLVGPYKSSFQIPPVPLYSSAETAGEMVELYGMALCRDIPYHEWSTSAVIQGVCDDLNELSDFRGPKNAGKVEPSTLFRGNSSGDLLGPYVSQFLYHSYNQGAKIIDQHYLVYTPQYNPVTTWEELLGLQNGLDFGQNTFGLPRYLSTLRDGATYVHHDTPVTSGINALNILYTIGCPYDEGLRLGESGEDAFVNIGPGDLYDLLTRVSHVALLCAWYQKWHLLRLRPEVFGMHVDTAKREGHSNGIHHDLLESEVLVKTNQELQSYVLSMAYPEGSPCHPSDPAGHATFSGAVVTVMKAFFDDSHPIELWEPSVDGLSLVNTGEMSTVGKELDKMASNIATFRNAAGVHYRSDALGIELGEELAILMIKEHLGRYPRTTKVSFTSRHGNTVNITA